MAIRIKVDRELTEQEIERIKALANYYKTAVGQAEMHIAAHQIWLDLRKQLRNWGDLEDNK